MSKIQFKKTNYAGITKKVVLDWDNPRKKYKKASETKLKRAVEENKETEILDNDAPLDNIHDFKRIKKE